MIYLLPPMRLGCHLGKEERELVLDAEYGPHLDDLHRRAAQRGAWIEVCGEQVISRPVILPTRMRVHCQCGHVEVVDFDAFGRAEPEGWLGHACSCPEASQPKGEGANG